MPTSRVMKAVLHNFLGTYLSRYSDFQGYWLFGFLIDEIDNKEIDLLGDINNEIDSPWVAARNLAIARFADQLSKSKLPLAAVRDASLHIATNPETATSVVNGRPTEGHMVRFCATAETLAGKKFNCENQVFVGRHNPRIELRSTRAIDG